MKQFLTGNLLLLLCCIFYLAWWIIAFKPVGAVKGMKSGWLLIPAACFGIAAVIVIIRGIAAVPETSMLFPAARAAEIGVLAYILLLVGTWLILHRPVTTELILIVGWAAIASAEVSALYGLEVYGKTASCVLIVCVIVMAVVSLICYLIYYHLDSVRGYYDGMVPLLIVALLSAGMSVSLL